MGSDFSFGKDREGDFAQLAAFGEELGFEAVSVDEVRSQGKRVSSTLIPWPPGGRGGRAS